MMRYIVFSVFFALLAVTARAEDVVLGLSQDRVAITTSFDGKEILIFGAVRREEPINRNEPLQVVITVEGPSTPIEVRRKSREYGIWINTDRVNVSAAPAFYAVASTREIGAVISHTEDLRHKISIERAIRSVGASSSVDDSQNFTDALIRVRRAKGLYRIIEGGVVLDQQTLFRTAIELPAQLVEGDYKTRIFLTRNGRVVSHLQTNINVRKVGLERILYSMSREQPAVYGIMAILVAAVAGWLAQAGFAMLRRP